MICTEEVGHLAARQLYLAEKRPREGGRRVIKGLQISTAFRGTANFDHVVVTYGTKTAASDKQVT